MFFLGVDLGTTGCKAVLFDENGHIISSDYREYLIINNAPGHAELDSLCIWNYVKDMIKDCSAGISEPIKAISVSSLGEAVVPVSVNREPIGNSILNYDSRGGGYLPWLHEVISDEDLYTINGNPLGPNYGLTKLLWYKQEQPDIYKRTHKFLLWGSYILFMMGADPVVDYALANRTLLLDIEKNQWNSTLIEKVELNSEKLPELAEAGTVCGKMSIELSSELGMSEQPLLVVGTHDQCANALGCGVLEQGTAMYGMGTYHCIVSVFDKRKENSEMLSRGLNTEHHAVPERWVSFIYNQGGILLKWFRDTFASESMNSGNTSVYTDLLSEMPVDPSSLSVLPHFITTGTPDFLDKTTGMISGLTIDTTRGDILKAVLEGIAFYLKENLDNLPQGMNIEEFHVVGGGSSSDIWMQLTADIMEKPCIRTEVSEAGSLGAAILAAYGFGAFKSIQEAVANMVAPGKKFIPEKDKSILYYPNFERYKEIYPLFGSFLARYKE
jgi:xylulokinase